MLVACLPCPWQVCKTACVGCVPPACTFAPPERSLVRGRSARVCRCCALRLLRFVVRCPARCAPRTRCDFSYAVWGRGALVVSSGPGAQLRPRQSRRVSGLWALIHAHSDTLTHEGVGTCHWTRNARPAQHRNKGVLRVPQRLRRRAKHQRVPSVPGLAGALTVRTRVTRHLTRASNRLPSSRALCPC